MKLSTEELNEIERLAGLFFPPLNIAIVLQVDVEAFLEAWSDQQSPIYARYWCGKLKTEAELRKIILQQAKQGSSPAQTTAMKLLEEMNQQENL